VAGSCEGEEIITRTWSLTDDCGNTTTHIQTITVIDNTAPVFSVPASDTICRNLDCTYDADPSVTGYVTDETDNCTAGIEATYEDDTSNLPDYGQAGFIIRTWSLSDGCGNITQKDQIIWVEPVVELVAGPDTLCSGETTNILVETNSISTNGIRYTWTVTDNPNVLNESGSIGNGQPVNSAIVQNLINTSHDKQSVTYTIVPHTVNASGNNACAGMPLSVEIWIEPTVIVDATPEMDTVCSGSQASILMNSPSHPTRPVLFRYSTIQPFGVTASPGSGNAWPEGSILTDELINTTDTAKQVLFIITPYTRRAGSQEEKCTGLPDTVSVWVEPLARLIPAPQADTICNLEYTDIRFASPTVSTRGIIFDYVALPDDPLQLTGYANGTGMSTDSIIHQELENQGNLAQRIVYRAIPYTLDGWGNRNCEGAPVEVIIWIEPTARITGLVQADTLCNMQSRDILLQSHTQPTRWVEFNVTAVPDHPAQVAGYSDFSRLPNLTTINLLLTNLSDSAQRILYIVQPILVDAGGAQSCSGISDTAEIWLEPAIRFTLGPSSDTLCDGGITRVIIASPTVPTRPIQFTYRLVADDPSELNFNGSWMAGNNKNDTLSEVIDNLGDEAQRLVMQVRPYTLNATGGENCTDEIKTVVIWVEPTPKATVSAMLDTICTQLNTSLVLSTITQSLQPVRFYYEAMFDPILVKVFYHSDTTALAPGFSIVDSVVNLTSLPQKVQVKVYPYLEDFTGSRKCEGIPVTATVWVAPKLIVLADTISTYIGGDNIRCSNMAGGFIRLKPTGGISAFPGYDEFDLRYQWNYLNRKTKDMENVRAGIYHVRVTDNLQCLDRDTFVLTQPTRLETFVNVVDTLSCQGSDGTLAAITQGGHTGYRYSWIPPVDYELDPPIYLDTLYHVREGIYYLTATDTNGCVAYASRPVSQPDPAGVSIHISDFGGYQIKCSGGVADSISTINNSGSIVVYTFTGPGTDTTFANADPINSIFDLREGLYTLRYEDQIGCDGVANIELTAPQVLQIGETIVTSQSSGYSVSCHGAEDGSIFLQGISGGHGSLGYLYDWTVISGEGTVTEGSRNQFGLAAGIYSVRVSDVYGCEALKSFTLTEPDEILLNAELSESRNGLFNIDCNGESTGFIRLNPSGGGLPGGDYDVQWQHGPVSSELSGLEAGQYIVEVTDEMLCSVMDTITLTEPEVLKLDSVQVSSHHSFAIACSGGSDGYIKTFVSGGAGGYHYRWSADGQLLPEDTAYLSDRTAGRYDLQVMDGNQCELTASVVLAEPPPIIATLETTNVNCTGTVKGTAGVQASGGAGGLNYLWSTGATTAAISGLEAGSYWLRIVDANSCVLQDTVEVIQNSSVEVSIEARTGISCSGDNDGVLKAIVNGGIAPYRYQWNTGSHADSLIRAGAGEYSVTVSDNDGCVGISSLILDDPDPLIPQVQTQMTRCFGSKDGMIDMAATGGTPVYRFALNGLPVGGIQARNLKAGNYTVIVLDENDCYSDTLVTIEQPLPLKVEVDEEQSEKPFCPDWENGALVIDVSGGTRDYTYAWGEYPDDTDSVLNHIKEGRYSIRIADAEGCVMDTSLTLTALNYTCLGIPSAFTPNHDNANDFWDISYINQDGGEARFHEVYPDGEIEVFDRLGNLVYRCAEGCMTPWNGEDLKGRLLPVDTYYYVIELNTNPEIPSLKGIVTLIR